MNQMDSMWFQDFDHRLSAHNSCNLKNDFYFHDTWESFSFFFLPEYFGVGVVGGKVVVKLFIDANDVVSIPTTIRQRFCWTIMQIWFTHRRTSDRSPSIGRELNIDEDEVQLIDIQFHYISLDIEYRLWRNFHRSIQVNISELHDLLSFSTLNIEFLKNPKLNVRSSHRINIEYLRSHFPKRPDHVPFERHSW